MELYGEQIEKFTLGACTVRDVEGGVRFSRFSNQEIEVYQTLKPSFLNKIVCTAGIRMEFETDAQVLFFQVNVQEQILNRSFFAFDFYIDGVYAACLRNFTDEAMGVHILGKKLPMGRFSLRLPLEKGTKRIRIQFPWSVSVLLERMCLEGATFANGIQPSKTILMYGDSITQGYDCYRPSNAYAVALADQLGMQLFDKGVGGEQFLPPLAKVRQTFTPDLITVAYGTNDWNHETAEGFTKKCRDFFAALRENYPQVPIFAITPIWRQDHTSVEFFCPFPQLYQTIRAISAQWGVTCLEGFDLVPGKPELFHDRIVHPNDLGFAHYTRNLLEKMRPYL